MRLLWQKRKKRNQKKNNLLITAKVHVPMKSTNPEHLKLTLQNICLENKGFKSEINQMKFETVNIVHKNTWLGN